MSNKGFTLVELLAVIVILAVILSIAIPGISGIIKNFTRNAFVSDAKMVLKAINYKLMEDDTFDPNIVNETNIKNLLNVGDDNYQSLTVKKANDTLYVTIVGKNKWDKLTVSGTKSIAKVNDSVTTFSNGANKPVLVTGMTPIKWNDTDWVDTTESDTDWYNYNTTDKKWANAKTADGSMWVWIPRYIYKISIGWHTITAGTIDIQFSKGVNDNWNRAIIGNINLGETANASNNTWTNHPAFTFGDTELTGLWVAKFEATAVEGVINGYTTDGSCTVNDDNVTTKTIQILPNVQSWRCVSIGNMFTNTRNMETNATYGWGTNGSGIDTHLMKNIEWGAVAYLSKSTYGQGTNEIWINPADNYTTGCAGTSATSGLTTGCTNTYDSTNGLHASATGNIYGIYDISGGSWEYVAAYVNNGNSNLGQGSTITRAASQYKDVYTVGGTDDQPNNYGLTINLKGDAVYETSNNISEASSWFNDYFYMPNNNRPWFKRGGCSISDSGAGAFDFYYYWGGAISNIGFRPVLLVNAGL